MFYIFTQKKRLCGRREPRYEEETDCGGMHSVLFSEGLGRFVAAVVCNSLSPVDTSIWLDDPNVFLFKVSLFVNECAEEILFNKRKKKNTNRCGRVKYKLIKYSHRFPKNKATYCNSVHQPGLGVRVPRKATPPRALMNE